MKYFPCPFYRPRSFVSTVTRWEKILILISHSENLKFSAPLPNICDLHRGRLSDLLSAVLCLQMAAVAGDSCHRASAEHGSGEETGKLYDCISYMMT